ncbi:hypothetical protein [Caulobacter segnis]
MMRQLLNRLIGYVGLAAALMGLLLLVVVLATAGGAAAARATFTAAQAGDVQGFQTIMMGTLVTLVAGLILFMLATQKALDTRLTNVDATVGRCEAAARDTQQVSKETERLVRNTGATGQLTEIRRPSDLETFRGVKGIYRGFVGVTQEVRVHAAPDGAMAYEVDEQALKNWSERFRDPDLQRMVVILSALSDDSVRAPTYARLLALIHALKIELDARTFAAGFKKLEVRLLDSAAPIEACFRFDQRRGTAIVPVGVRYWFDNQAMAAAPMTVHVYHGQADLDALDAQLDKAVQLSRPANLAQLEALAIELFGPPPRRPRDGPPPVVNPDHISL